MSGISETLRSYRVHEEQLVSRLRWSRSQVNPVATEAAKGLVGELAATAAGELFGLRSVGRRVGKAFVSHGQKQSLMGLERNIQAQHEANVTSILSFLAGISEKTRRLNRPNSSRLMRRIARVQGFARLETKISKTIAELQNLELADLVSNRDIENLGQSQSQVSQRFSQVEGKGE